MQTKLSVYSDWIMEAGWLAAIVATPLFFNAYSSRVFEPDKIAVFRSIVLVMAVAWIVNLLERMPWRAKGSSPPVRGDWFSRFCGIIPAPPEARLITLALVFAGVYVIGTIVSVAPWTSLWGSYQRLQGTYTTFSYILFFIIVASRLRTRAQLERTITFALVASVPISFYGILQHFHLDPLPWQTDVSARVTSTMGNAIFVAAYLILVVPLTLYRLIDSVAGLRRVPPSSPSERATDLTWLAAFAVMVTSQTFIFYMAVRQTALNAGDPGFWWLLPLAVAFLFGTTFIFFLARREGSTMLAGKAIGCVILLITQVVALFLSQSRGPWLGLLAGLFVFLLIITVRRGLRRALGGVIAASAIVLVVLVLLNVPNSPLQILNNTGFVGRLDRVLETDSGTGKVRMLIWGGAVEMIKSDPVRLVLGYGPESMYVAYSKFYPPDLAHIEARNATPDRSHNGLLDAVVTTGLIGLVAYLALFGGFFWYAAKRLWKEKSLKNQLLLSALLGALTSHLVEIQTGIPIVATLTYFWFYLALLVAIGRSGERPTEIEVRVTETSAPQQVRSGKTKRKTKQDVRAAARTAPSSPRFSPTIFARSYWIGYAPLIILAVLAMAFLNVNVVRADVSYKQGLSYDLAKQWDKSVKYYQEAIDLAPDQDYYYLFMGRAYMDWAQSTPDQTNKVSLLQQSEKALLAAKQASPLNTDHYANLARLYKFWNSATGEATYLDKAETYYREATRLSPHNVGIADELAAVYLSKGEFTEAKDELNRSLALDQQYANTYVTLGDAFRMTNDPKQATQYYAKAIAIDPQAPLSDNSFDARLTYVLSSGQVGGLIDAYKGVTSQQPDSVAAHSALGYLYSRNGDTQNAVLQFEQAVALAPNDFNSLRNLALAYRDAKLTDKALSEAQVALSLAPPDQAPGIQSLIAELQKAKS